MGTVTMSLYGTHWMRRSALLALVFFSAIVSAKPRCNMGTKHQHTSYPPDAKTSVKWYTVDLDQPASTRWNHVVTPQKDQIKTLTNVVEKTLRKVVGNGIVDGVLAALNTRLDLYSSVLPNDYGEEIQGIAKAVQMDPAVIFFYNMFYTVFGACTSIVAQSTDRQYHARNLDFGLWPSFNLSKGELWELNAALRPLVINVKLQRNGTTLYNATTFNGFVGMHTAVRAGVMSLTIDTRFDSHLDAGLLKWLAEPKKDSSSHEITMACRAALESSTSYEEGLSVLNSTKMMGPGYIIVGGPSAGQGAVLTKGAKGLFKPDGETVAVPTLANQLKNGSHFLVQTNYDGDADDSHPPSGFDNRRDPAKLCMKSLGPEGTDFKGLYNLLSSTPNLNKLTTYTTLMIPKTGELESYHQHCTGFDCPLF